METVYDGTIVEKKFALHTFGYYNLSKKSLYRLKKSYYKIVLKRYYAPSL